MTPTFRFAPSPTGFLHLGHALSAIEVWRAAEALGGRVLLRIEDIDPTRCKPEFSTAIEEDLGWLGLAWDGTVRSQSEHFDDYAAALGRLDAMGLIIPCRLARSDIAAAVALLEAEGHAVPRDPDGAARLPLNGARPSDPSGPTALRLDMSAALKAVGGGALGWTEQGAGPAGETGLVAARPEDWGDVVLARKETPTSYHLAVTVDDAIQGVTHVVRGQDLFYATAVHRLLQALLGLPAPVYRHHRLIDGADGEKLAKSKGAPSLRALRAEGWTPNDVRRAIEPF